MRRAATLTATHTAHRRRRNSVRVFLFLGAHPAERKPRKCGYRVRRTLLELHRDELFGVDGAATVHIGSSEEHLDLIVGEDRVPEWRRREPGTAPVRRRRRLLL
jgi:hypothetical protein